MDTRGWMAHKHPCGGPVALRAGGCMEHQMFQGYAVRLARKEAF